MDTMDNVQGKNLPPRPAPRKTINEVRRSAAVRKSKLVSTSSKSEAILTGSGSVGKRNVRYGSVLRNHWYSYNIGRQTLRIVLHHPTAV